LGEKKGAFQQQGLGTGKKAGIGVTKKPKVRVAWGGGVRKNRVTTQGKPQVRKSYGHRGKEGPCGFTKNQGLTTKCRKVKATPPPLKETKRKKTAVPAECTARDYADSLH